MVWVVFCCFCLPSKAQYVTVPIGNTGMGVTVYTGTVQLANINNNPNATRINVSGEDQAPTKVPIGFSFPYFGKTFVDSWMSENGVVTFKDPKNYSFCCNGLPITSLNSSQFDNTIFPLWSDWSTKDGGSLYTLGNGSSRTYGWYGVNEYGTKNKNSFELKINSDGTFLTAMSGALVSLHQVSSGFTGDLKAGEKYQSFYKHADGLQDKSQMWSYGKLPVVTAPVVEAETMDRSGKGIYSLFEVPTTALVDTSSTKGIDFAGNDLIRMSMRNNSSNEEERQEKRREKKETKENDAPLGDGDNYFVSTAVQNASMSILSFNNPLVLSLYSKPMPDAPFYRDRGVYRNQRVIDNERASRALQSEGMHKALVDQQWNLSDGK